MTFLFVLAPKNPQPSTLPWTNFIQRKLAIATEGSRIIREEIRNRLMRDAVRKEAREDSLFTTENAGTPVHRFGSLHSHNSEGVKIYNERGRKRIRRLARAEQGTRTEEASGERSRWKSSVYASIFSVLYTIRESTFHTVGWSISFSPTISWKHGPPSFVAYVLELWFKTWLSIICSFYVSTRVYRSVEWWQSLL